MSSFGGQGLAQSYVSRRTAPAASFCDNDALSNFVADAPNVVGFDPFVSLVDFIAEHAARFEGVRAWAG